MLWVYVPRGTSLERIPVTSDADVPESAVWFDLVNPTLQEDKTRRTSSRHRGPDARGDAGNRGHQPPLRRERRALHDRDPDVPVRHRRAEDHAGHLHPVRPPADHRALRRAAAVHDRRQQARADLPADGHRRIGADGPARRGDRPRGRHSGADRRRGRSGLARYFRAGGRPDRSPAATTRSSRPSAARATSPPRCAKAWSRSAACCSTSPTKPTACAGRRSTRAQLRGMQRDVQSLSDHAAYLSNKITFLLDAMLGVVTIEQNNIIKIFSVAAVVLMPPTLIASIYGMNFHHMPELDWKWGYPIAIVSDGGRGRAALLLLQVEEMAVTRGRSDGHRSAPSSDVLAAVDVDLGAVHVRGHVRAQHVDDLGDLVGGAEAVQRESGWPRCLRCRERGSRYRSHPARWR